MSRILPDATLRTMGASLTRATALSSLALATALALSSCANEVRTLSWEFQFATVALGERAVVVEGRVIRGGCSGTDVVHTAEATRTLRPSAPPALSPGRYGLAGRARDASCTWFASGCQDIEVPQPAGTMLVVTLGPTSDEAACAASVCTDGQCGALDAGPSDAGSPDAARGEDARGPDAGSADAGSLDAGSLDARTADVGAGDGGIADAPVADAGRDTGPDASCTASSCGACASCVAGRCMPLPDGTMCAGGVCGAGACCPGCFDGVSCAAGTSAMACGTAGVSCARCSGGTPYCDGGCAPPRRVSQITLGTAHACAISLGNIPYCWGNNLAGQLGVGTSGAGTESATPVRVGLGADWTSVGAGDDHVCGVRRDGALSCWGQNSDGQLGLGDVAPRSSPSVVSLPAMAASVDGGPVSDHTCILSTAGAVLCMGQGVEGQLGRGDFLDRNTAAALPGTYRALGVGHRFTCAIRTDGALLCWGHNNQGQIGNGLAGPTMEIAVPTQVGTATDWASVTTGDEHVCGVRAGALYCWGLGTNGQLGLGSATPRATTPTRVGTATDWGEIAGGGQHTCGLRAGALYCWGLDDEGQLGNGDPTRATQLAPVRIGTETDWTAVAAGNAFTCAVRGSGRLFCWGRNVEGQLGQGDRMGRDAPVEVLIPRP